jgi:hypothetical protein
LQPHYDDEDDERDKYAQRNMNGISDDDHADELRTLKGRNLQDGIL